MTMDEAHLRVLLSRIEDPPEPSSTVNLAQVLAAGRRKLRRHRIARAGTSVLAVFTAVVMAVPACGWLSHEPPGGLAAGQAPRSFNPLVPDAFFARLPGGATELSLATSAGWLKRDVAERTRAPLSLVVVPARECQIAGRLPYWYRTRPGGPVETPLHASPFAAPAVRLLAQAGSRTDRPRAQHRPGQRVLDQQLQRHRARRPGVAVRRGRLGLRNRRRGGQ
jgi:hypothetical protein